jgi:putative FmdB family regulatory protein
MPIYDFRCPQCGLEFEVSRSRDDAGKPALCPIDKTEATRVFSTMGFVMKGEARFSPTPAPADGGHDHGPLGHGHSHGHSHGPGTHTH